MILLGVYNIEVAIFNYLLENEFFQVPPKKLAEVLVMGLVCLGYKTMLRHLAVYGPSCHHKNILTCSSSLA